VSDAAKNPRGLALQFQLPMGELHQMAMLNTPVFGAATPRSFYERQLADAPDPATGKRDPEKLKAYEAKFPESKAQTTWLAGHNPPPSYANVTFYSLHAFKFIDASQGEHWVKWRFEPRDGAQFLSDDELAKTPREFLAQRIVDRTRQAPIAWDMIVSLGEKGDPLDNPSVAWPAERGEIKAGTLTLTRAGEDTAATCEDINFDPNVLSAGVEPSPDPVLAYRSGAYAVSYSRRLDDKAK
jgi:catalase